MVQRLTPEPRKRDSGHRKYGRYSNRDPVEISLNNIGPRKASTHATAEHVGNASTPTRMKQDQKYEA
jgi:hypothetical protein